ncbi:MAG TPA: hypothetical protein VFQ54_00275 [Thermomicrobiales bacterium]|nr:hypothetical protein [Thermomicrobiales bacterium]
MADDLKQVLNYIVNRFVVDDELRTIDREAPVMAIAPTEPDRDEVAQREESRAVSLADAFVRGLIRAWQRFTMGGNELPLDDRKEDENRMADALIRFLVSYDLASSRTEVTGDRTYTYYLSIRWPQLRDVALAAGVDLDRALSRQLDRSSR